MENGYFSNASWTRFVFDGQMRILEIINPDDRLFFGRRPVPGETLAEAAGDGNGRPVTAIADGLDRARREKRNTCFEYLSAYAEGQCVHVCVFAEYRLDGSVCLSLASSGAPGQPVVQQTVGGEVKPMLQSVCDNLPIGLEIYDRNGRLIEINAYELEVMGIRNKEDALGVNLFENPNLTDEVRLRLLAGESLHITTDYDFSRVRNYFETSKTSVRHLEVSINVMRDTTGAIDKYLVISQDITERVRNEEQLHRSRQKSERAMQAADIMLWEFDVLSRLFYSDNEPLNGYDNARPLTVADYTDSVHPDDRELVAGSIGRMCAGEDFSCRFNVRALFPGSPEWQYCTVTGAPYEKDADGMVVRYVGARKNDTELQRRKLLQDNILNSIPMSIHIKDVENDFRYVFCNEESKRMFGTSEEKTLFDVMDADEVERIRKTDLEVFNTGRPYFGLERIVLKNGRSYDAIVRKSVIYDNGKRLLLSVRWDQGMQNDLERRAKLLSLTLEAMKAFTWFYEPDKTRISFGDGFDKVGRPASEVNTLEKFVACIHPDDVLRFVASLDAVVAEESGVWEIECRIDLKGDGTYTWWWAHGILETAILNDAPYKYMFGMTISVESHKQAELTLLKNREEMAHLIRQNELVLNNTNSGLAYITPDYIVQWENISKCSASLSFEAYKQGEFCYKSAHNRTSPCENCVLQRTLLSRQTEQIKFGFDSGHTVEIFATPVLRDDGTVDGIVIRVDDVTERERMIGELRQAKSLAEQSDKLKSAFLANMSHEIRTPLNAIVGFSELLLDSSGEEREEYMQIINSNNELLLKLINDILDLSKIEAGSVELNYETFDLSEYFDGLAASMKQRVTRPGVELVAVNPYSDCRVTLDKNRMAQIIINYVTNAIKYTPEGVIEMGYAHTDDGIRFYVRDTGIGIPEEKKGKVFHRFAKLDEFAQGTGLGLSICKAIAESMNGSVGFESGIGEGSLFWAELPCSPKIGIEANVRQESPIYELHTTDIVPVTNPNVRAGIPEGASSARKTILVAEDIPGNYQLVSAMLQKHFDLIHARNGQQAIELVRSCHFDLLLIDMKMPVMDGLTAAAEIRKFNGELPIVALTAHAFESDRVAALNAGCNEFLVKPIDKTRLMAVTRKYCTDRMDGGNKESCADDRAK